MQLGEDLQAGRHRPAGLARAAEPGKGLAQVQGRAGGKGSHSVRLGRATGGGMRGLQGPLPLQVLVHLRASHSWQFDLYLEQAWHFLPSKNCAKPPAADGRRGERCACTM